jgi:MFS family permease
LDVLALPRDTTRQSPVQVARYFDTMARNSIGWTRTLSAISPTGAATCRYPHYVLGLLTLVSMVNAIDRQVLAVLIEPIKREFGVSDTAMGLLTGFAFVIFYMLAGIPIARWADRGSRKRIVAAALAFWSAATAASGLVRSFAELAIARILVGVGEAGGNAPSYSLLSDYFPPQRRATALAIYSCGLYVGAALAFLAGGWLVTHYDWRVVFYLVGLPGLVLAALVALTVRELPRGASEQRAAAEASVPFAQVLRFLLRRRAFRLVALGAALQSISGYGVITWGPTFLSRVHHMSFAEIGVIFGIIIGLVGSVGAVAGGRMADRLGRRDPAWYMRLPAMQSVLALPFLFGFALLPQAPQALASFVPFYALGAMYIGPMFSVVHGLVDLRMRATATAILMFIVNLVGLGLGPLLVGFLNDHVFGAAHGPAAIRYSLLAVGLFSGLAGLFFWRASPLLRAEPAG